MEYREDIGFQIRTLSHLVKRVVDQTAFTGESEQPTGVQGWIIGYLYQNRGPLRPQGKLDGEFPQETALLRQKSHGRLLPGGRGLSLCH